MTPPADDKADSTAGRRRAVLKERAGLVAAYELDADIVPGTCRVEGATPDTVGTPAGGQEWEGLARMANARRPADRTERDWEALGRHPEPRSGITGLP